MEATPIVSQTKLPINDQQFDQKTRLKMEFIYKSLENGWIVRKLENNKYEFIKGTTSVNNNEYESPRRSVSSPIVKNIKFKFKN